MSTLSSYDDFIVSPAEQRARAAARRARFYARPAPRRAPEPVSVPDEPSIRVLPSLRARRWSTRWDAPLRALSVAYGAPFSDDVPPVQAPTMREIFEFGVQHFGVSAEDLRSGRRPADIAHPRHCIAWMMCRLTAQSLPSVGRFIGNRDHTTIINSRRRVDTAIANGESLGLMATEALAAFEAWRLER